MATLSYKGKLENVISSQPCTLLHLGYSLLGKRRRISNIMEKWQFLTQSSFLVFEIGAIKVKNSYPAVCLLSVNTKTLNISW